ncbi:MAG: NUDIX domain-containing protein [Candidatus Magasanikbacteria bacterium]|nr:NUDIX domain-containing protein [Candidatus Magasanikbacteria bacterium]
MKIQKHAKKVFTGVIFDVYQWEQEMYDGSTATFERLKRPDTIQIICTEGNKIIIAEEEQPGKPRGNTLIGGRQEQEEEPIICAKRELLEETGMVSDDIELFKTYEPYNKIDWKVHVFIAKNCKKIAEQNLDPGEKITVKKVSFDKFVDIVCTEDFWCKEIKIDILKMRLDGTLDEFKKKIFG